MSYSLKSNFRTVVFPEPETPTSAIFSPGFIESEKFLSTDSPFSWYVKKTLSNSIFHFLRTIGGAFFISFTSLCTSRRLIASTMSELWR